MNGKKDNLIRHNLVEKILKLKEQSQTKSVKLQIQKLQQLLDEK